MYNNNGVRLMCCAYKMYRTFELQIYGGAISENNKTEQNN